MIKKFLFFFVISLGVSSLSAQVNVIMDREEGIAELEALHISAWNEVGKTSGFRIQLASASGANSSAAIEELKEKFKEEFKDIPSYIIYSEPYFRFRVGDFQTKLEAYHYLNLLAVQYPGAFIIRDQINYKEVEEEVEE